MNRDSTAFDNGTLPRRLRALMLRVRSLFAGRRLDTDLNAELESHLQLHVDDSIRKGMRPEEARRQAILTLGGIEQTKERYRDRRGFRPIDELVRDVRYAGRFLRKNIGFTLVAVLSLALGIGANAAIYSLFYQVLLRPLPVLDPARLVNLSGSRPNPGPKSCVSNAGGCDVVFSYPMFRDLERVQTSFTGIAAHRRFGANLAYRGQTVSGAGLLVSGSYFPVLGLQPALGRLLGAGDDRTRGESPVAVLSYAYWRSSFGARPTVLNDTMVINGHTVTIVGVAPRVFEGTILGEEPQVFVPITMRWLMDPVDADREPDHENRRHYWIYLFARLRPGISLEQAHTAINVPYHAIINDVEAPLQPSMSDETMARFRAKEMRVDAGGRGQSDVRTKARVPLMLLLGATTLVLLIACVNIANLLLARAAARSSEMALRVSIGASRWHLITQLLTESLLLALVGGAASILVARWTMSLLRSLLSAGEWARLPLQLDASATIVTAALALGTGLLVGLVPALHAARGDALGPLKGQAGQPSGGRGAARVRLSLATAQIALSMVLLVLAGLFTKSLVNVSRVDLGLTIDHLLTFGISPERNGYTPERSAVLFARLEEELRSLPGVTAATSSRVPLLQGFGREDDVVVEGLEVGPDADDTSFYDEIGPGYFRTLGIPLISGREFTRADSLNAARVAIVNEQFAEKFHLGRDAVGKRMATENETLDVEIVGLVKDARLFNVKNAMPPTFFLPHRQNAELGQMMFHVRTARDPEQLGATLRQAVSRLDPNLPVDGLRTVPQQVREEMVLERFLSVLTTGFAVLAMLLAAIGLYGVLAYTLAQRTREIGLRMALGATRGRVRRMVLHQVGLMTLIGGTIGVVAALAVGRAAQALLFELEGHDPMVLTAAAVALTLVALGAGWIPAHRASRIDPMRALKYE